MPKLSLRSAVAAQPSRMDSFSFPAISPAARSRPAAWRSPQPRSVVSLGIVAVLLIAGGVVHADPVAAAPPTIATTVDPFAVFVAEASQRFGIPASWIRAVMQVESGGDVRALSPKGAMGLMQIMPETWAALRSRYDLGADPYDAHDNILAGAAYLRELHDRYGSPGFLAAYNAGPARYEDHLATGQPLPVETQAYLSVLGPLAGGDATDGATLVNAVVRSWTEAPLFVVPVESKAAKSPVSSDPRSGGRSADNAAADWTALAPQSQGLFVSLSRGNRQP